MFKIIGVDCVADDSNFVIKNSDITTGGNAINISKSVNGEITGSTINVTGNNRIINCSGGTSNLTIIDSDLNNEKSASKREGIIMYAGTLNIKGTTKIKSGGAAIYSSEDSDITVNIESGEIESTNLQAIVMNKANGNINIGKKDEEVHTDSPILKSAISEWTIRSDMMNLNFYDGKLIGGQYKIIGASIDNLADGCDLVNSKYTDESGKDVEEIHLGEAEGEAELIKNGSESGEKYGTLKEAVEKADNTQNSNNQITIKVLKDIYQAHQITIEENQNIKIDLNGNKFFAMTDEALYNKGTLEIIDNTKTDLETEPESDDDYNLIGSTGAVIIHNVGVKNGDETSSKGKLTLGKGVKVNYTASGTSKGR